MRSIKALGLAAVAAITAMAFIGTTSASAVPLEVVLCKQLIEKGKSCPPGQLWPDDSLVLALAENPRLESTILGVPFIVECPDSLVVIETTATIGSPLPGTITSLEFGKLPTPSLGSGCTGCTAGMHAKVPLLGNFGVSGEDEFFLESAGEWTSKGCPFNTTCVYGGTIKSYIEHKGKHALHEGENLPVVLISTTLEKRAGSSGICPNTCKWIASYVFYLVHYQPPVGPSELGLGWPALDQK